MKTQSRFAVTIPESGVTSITTNTGLSTNVSATGDVTITNTGVRSITAPAAGITVSPTTGDTILALANDLAAVEGLGTTGITARTGTSTWATRTITAGDGISVTNGDGVSGNPTITLNNTYYHVRTGASDLFTSVSATERVVKLNTASGSSGFSFDNGTDLITITNAGTYIITYGLTYKHNAASYGTCYLKVNGVQDNTTIKRIDGTIYHNSIFQTSLITTVGSNTTLGLYTWVTTGSINDQHDDAVITILRVA